MPEIYFSIDVETNGPIPGYNSMLSLGAAAFTEEGGLVSTYSVNLKELEGGVANPSTMSWWQSQPEAWAACRSDQKDIDYAMTEFKTWIEATSYLHRAKPVCIAYPAGFDFMFVYWYLIRWTGSSPFSFSCLDIKTLAYSLLKTTYRESSKKYWKKEWFSETPHNHISVIDAIGQGESFLKMLEELKAN